MEDLEERVQIARDLLSSGITELDLEMHPDLSLMPADAGLTADLAIPFPDGLAPIPAPIVPAPDPTAPLPAADVVVITWTVDENDALADVLTPGQGRLKWHRYARDFALYAPKIRGGAPAQHAQRLGSYMPTSIGGRSVLCVKSELHLNQDSLKTGEGTATLPVKDFFKQIIDEVKPKVVLTIGTSGSVFEDFQLGDVAVTRAAKFRCASEFRNEVFNHQTFTSDWQIPTTHLDEATALMRRFAPDLAEPPFLPPTKAYHYHGAHIHTDDNLPDIKMEQGARDMPEFHPILTTDFFEYGTSSNGLQNDGCAVEMGDAVLGLVVSEMAEADRPKWAVVRNMSDPTINGDLPTTEYQLNLQTEFAVAYYLNYGYTTSVTGALATWGIIAGLDL
jgi:hypothetical protein